MNLKTKLLSIINKINDNTGKSDTNVTDAVKSLLGGGSGSQSQDIFTVSMVQNVKTDILPIISVEVSE